MSTTARWIDPERLLWIVGDVEIALDVRDTTDLLAKLREGNEIAQDLWAKLTEQRPGVAA